QLGDDTHAINTTDKYTRKSCWDTTNNRLMIAAGANATDPWYTVDGQVEVTPGTGTTSFLPGTELTIASGVITITSTLPIVYHMVDTESDAASDDLDTISGGIDGQRLVLRTVTGSRDVTVKNNTGNIRCG